MTICLVSKFEDVVKTKLGFMCASADIRLFSGENVLPSTESMNDWAWAVDKNFGSSNNPLTATIHVPAKAQASDLQMQDLINGIQELKIVMSMV